MSIAPVITITPPVVDHEGNHWEQHGRAVYQIPRWGSQESLATASSMVVYTRGDEKRSCEVLLATSRDPFSMSFYMEPDDADAIADALRLAAQQARAVRALKAQRAAGEVRP